MTNDESPVVTRSVEIPEAAVKKAAEEKARRDFGMLGFRNAPERGTRERYEDDARAMLQAALPDLVPARDGDPSARVIREHEPRPMGCSCGALMGDSIDYRWHLVNQAVAATAAPAGDGGLREALAELKLYCSKYVDGDGSEDEQIAYDDIHIRLSQILAAHPAAPAVPQLAEKPKPLREALDNWPEPEGTFDEVLERSAQARLSGGAVPQPADERPLRAALERYFSNGGPDTPIRTTWHEGVEHWEAPAEDIRELIDGSAVPQPVDREALRTEIIRVIDKSLETGALNPDDVVAAVLAVLAGEQEQVEP